MLASSSRLVVIGMTGAVFLIAAASLRAQGNGRFTPPGLAKKTATTSPNILTTPNEPLPEPSRRLQTFGSWLDTANVNAPGEAWMWVSTSYWRSPSLREIDAPGIRRVNLVLPLSAQTYAGVLRMYGSTGFFSRGSVFGTGAVEWPVRNHLTFTTSFAHSYSVVSDPTSDTLGISRHRTDASGGVYVGAGDALVFFASVGRTLSPITQTSGRLSLIGGLTINVAGPAAHPPRVP
jgi:hypothetical protein